MKNPQSDPYYLIHWVNKLDIANCDLNLLRDEDGTDIVVSYKSVGINTYNVFVIDLKTKLIKYWHESNQLWES